MELALTSLSNNVRNQPLSPEVGAQERAARFEAKKAKIAADADAAMNNIGASVKHLFQ